LLTKIEAYQLTDPIGAPTLSMPLESGEIDDSPLQIKNVAGAGPVKSEIATGSLAEIDGEYFTGSSTPKRNLVLTIGLNPDWATQTIESLRALVYKAFMVKNEVHLRFYSTHLPTCAINGHVESAEPNIFSRDPEFQVSIICPQPDFLAVALTVYTGVVGSSGT
jgi:hypothetical protein